MLTRLGDVSELGPGGHLMGRNADAEIEGKVCVCGASVVLGHDVVMPPCRVHTQEYPTGRAAAVIAIVFILSGASLLVWLGVCGCLS